MTKITFVDIDGNKTILKARDGDNLMQAAVAGGIEGIVGECCGAMMCATCHIYVEEPHLSSLSERSEGEEEMLECTVSKRRKNSRLSCQIKIGPDIDGIVVHLPEEQ